MHKFYDFFKSKQLGIHHGVIYLSNKELFAEKERLYLEIRKKEDRLYSDETVRTLPVIDNVHQQKNEWLIRKHSLQNLFDYLTKLNRPLTVLDLGCGNGWMANNLSSIPHIEIYALDLNSFELEQGRRVFSDKENITFLYGNVFDDVLPFQGFDIIVLSSSIQYFSDLTILLHRLQELLTATGEIHILDTIFYASDEVAKAKERSYTYYQSKNVPKMSKYYFHHTLDTFKLYKYKILSDPRKTSNKVSNKLFHDISSPFYWVVILK